MNNTLCNATITFNDKESVTVERLDEAQALQLQQVLAASGVWYRWNGDYYEQRTIGARLSALWRRFATWAMPLLLLALSLAAYGQDHKPAAVEPIRVTLTMLGDEAQAGELDRLLRRELPRAVVIVSRRPQYAIRIAVAPLDGETNKCVGYVSALIAQGKDDEAHLSLFVGDGLQSLARQLAEKLQEFLHSHREKK